MCLGMGVPCTMSTGKRAVKERGESESLSVMSDSLQPHGILQTRIREWVAFPFSRGSSQPGIEPRSPALQAGSLPAEPPGKLKERGGMKSQDPNSVIVLKAVRTSRHLKR